MEYLKLGKIIKPHGLKGEVKIFSTTDFASVRYKKGNVVFILTNNEYKPLTVNSYYHYQNFDVVSFTNYLDVSLVDHLLGKEIFVKKSDAVLPNNHYHYNDLINLSVVNNDKVIGKVIGVLEIPANDILRCETPDHKKFDIPFVDEFIKEIDLNKKIVKVELIEGIL